jgi:radical SAM protein with 4Fe4S-binding SPASM domain
MRNELSYEYFYHLAYTSNTPVSVMIELLSKCNLRCKHCYIPDYTNPGMSSGKIKSLLHELRELGVLNVSFTGGEIFLRDDIIELIETARNLHMRVFLLSNATVLKESTVRRLSELYISELSTTVFSLNADIHDSITGTKGSLSTVLRNLQRLKEYGIRVKVKTPVMSVNTYCFPDIQEYCIQNNFDFFVSPNIFSKLDGDGSPRNLRVSQEELQFIIKDIDRLNDNGKKEMYKHEVPCAALFYSFSIDCKGDVYPCNSFQHKVGNVYEQSVKEIWHESTSLKLINSIKKEDLQYCTGCNVQSKCYRCPAMAFNDSGSLLSCDTFAKTMAEAR